MSNTDERPVCDICGEPATRGERDMKETSQPTDSWETFGPSGKVRCGCDEHPPKPSETFDDRS